MKTAKPNKHQIAGDKGALVVKLKRQSEKSFKTRIKRIKEMRAKGWGYCRIGKALGIHAQTVKSFIKRNEEFFNE